MFFKWLIFLSLPYTFYSLCPVGFTQMYSNPNKCFLYAYEVYMTATQAVAACKKLGYPLLTIDSQEENDELLNIILNCGGPKCGSAWIGLNYDNNTHSWSDGYPIMYNNVNESSPFCNDGYSDQHYFLSWDSYWYNCPEVSYKGKVHGALCEYRSDCPKDWLQSTVNPANCISTQINKQPFFSSNDVCSSLSSGSTIATIFSEEANHELQVAATAQAINCYQFYINLVFTGGQWKWFSGETVNYTNWQTGYPSSDPNAVCAMLNIEDGTWTNVECQTPGCFICQKYLAIS